MPMERCCVQEQGTGVSAGNAHSNWRAKVTAKAMLSVVNLEDKPAVLSVTPKAALIDRDGGGKLARYVDHGGGR